VKQPFLPRRAPSGLATLNPLACLHKRLITQSRLPYLGDTIADLELEHGPCTILHTAHPCKLLPFATASASSLNDDTPKSGDRMEPFRVIDQPTKPDAKALEIAPLSAGPATRAAINVQYGVVSIPGCIVAA
jgi:hypothetical protein